MQHHGRRVPLHRGRGGAAVTPAEEAVVKALIKQTTCDAIDDGLQLAVTMIRMAAGRHPEMTLEQVADAIEAIVGKHSND